MVDNKTEFLASITNPQSKQFAMEVFGTDKLPILNPLPTKITLENGQKEEAYLLDLKRITPEELEKLIIQIAKMRGHPEAIVRIQIAKQGFPILARNCTVAIPLRYFT